MPWETAAQSGGPAVPPAAAAAPPAAAPPATDAKLGDFMKELDETAEKDSVWTKEKQIERLTKPGSKYLNLNPYEVLQIEPDTDPTVVKKQTRKLMALVHPDKNEGSELSTRAFKTVGEAKKQLADEAKMSFVHKVLDEAKEKTKFMVKEKRGQARKSGSKTIPEDNPIKYHELYTKNCKILFAEYSKRKEQLENEQAEAKKKNEEAKQEAFAKRKREQEEADSWNKGRDGRINSWRSFEKKKKRKKAHGFMKPPKLKTEQRSEKKK